MYLLVKPADFIKLIDSRPDGTVLFEVTRGHDPNTPVLTVKDFDGHGPAGEAPRHPRSTLAVRFVADGALGV